MSASFVKTLFLAEILDNYCIDFPLEYHYCCPAKNDKHTYVQTSPSLSFETICVSVSAARTRAQCEFHALIQLLGSEPPADALNRLHIVTSQA